MHKNFVFLEKSQKNSYTILEKIIGIQKKYKLFQKKLL